MIVGPTFRLQKQQRSPLSPFPSPSPPLSPPQRQSVLVLVVAAIDDEHLNRRRAPPMNCQAQGKPPLEAIVEAFEQLAGKVDSAKDDDLQLKDFCDACSLVSILFDSLGIAFKFAELEYCAKVRSLAEASKKYDTLQTILDNDIRNKKVKCQGSHSRNLRRVRQGIDLIRALFEQFLSTSDGSLKEAATNAYSQTCKPYHTWAVRAAVAAGMYALPTRDQLLIKLNETEESADMRMRKYITLSLPIIQYIDKLYTSRNINLDW